MAPSLRICVYNYKGGAAKTTIIVNTAAALAHPQHGNKKVLLIDLDPQCNSTQFYHDDNESSGGGRTITKDETEPTGAVAAAATLAHLPAGCAEPMIESDELHPTIEAASMDALVSGQSKSPLYKFMHALFVDQEASTVRTMIENQRHDLLHKVNVDEHTQTSEFGDNFWLLEGDPSISEFEAQIAHAFNNFEKKGMLKHYGLMSYLMNVFTEVLGFDMIMIDCSPSNSALNKAAALACDYILPPCMASLYSAGSVAGLLSTVLPGEDGWLGLHDKICKRWRDEGTLRPKADVAQLEEWMLPPNAPQLLPIMVSNYAMGLKSESMKAEPILSGARRKKTRAPPMNVTPGSPGSGDTRVVKLMQSQFVYTIMNYCNQECQFIAGHEQGPPADFKGPLIRFRENHGRRVINFCESAAISMPVSEQVGRSFVELQLIDFLFYIYGEQKTNDMLEEAANAANAANAASGKKRKASQVGMIDYGTDSHIFEAEVKKMQRRYSALSAWLVHLLAEKRGVV